MTTLLELASKEKMTELTDSSNNGQKNIKKKKGDTANNFDPKATKNHCFNMEKKKSGRKKKQKTNTPSTKKKSKDTQSVHKFLG